MAFCVGAAGRIEVARGKKANPFKLTVDQLLPSASMSIKSKLVQPVQRLPQLRLLAGELIKQCEKAVKRHVRIAAAGVLVSKKADAAVVGAVSKGVDAIGAAAALCNMAIKDRQCRERSAVLHSTVFSSDGATLGAPEITSRRLLLECGAFQLYVDPSAAATPKPKAGIFGRGLFAKKVAGPKRSQLVIFSDVLVVASVNEASGDGGNLGDIYQVEKSTITHVFTLDSLLPSKLLFSDANSFTVSDRSTSVTLTAVDEGDEPAVECAARVLDAINKASTEAHHAAMRGLGLEPKAARSSTSSSTTGRGAKGATKLYQAAMSSGGAAIPSRVSRSSALNAAAAKGVASRSGELTAQAPDHGAATATREKPDGSKLEVFSDETKRTTFKDGTVMDVKGTVRTQYNPNGSAVRTDSKDAVVKSHSIVSSGTRITKYANGDTLQRNPDGTTIRKSKRTGACVWVSVFVCARARVCVCVCVFARARPRSPSLAPLGCSLARSRVPHCSIARASASAPPFVRLPATLTTVIDNRYPPPLLFATSSQERVRRSLLIAPASKSKRMAHRSPSRWMAPLWRNCRRVALCSRCACPPLRATATLPLRIGSDRPCIFPNHPSLLRGRHSFHLNTEGSA